MNCRHSTDNVFFATKPLPVLAGANCNVVLWQRGCKTTKSTVSPAPLRPLAPPRV